MYPHLLRRPFSSENNRNSTIKAISPSRDIFALSDGNRSKISLFKMEPGCTDSNRQMSPYNLKVYQSKWHGSLWAGDGRADAMTFSPCGRYLAYVSTEDLSRVAILDLVSEVISAEIPLLPLFQDGRLHRWRNSLDFESESFKIHGSPFSNDDSEKASLRSKPLEYDLLGISRHTPPEKPQRPQHAFIADSRTSNLRRNRLDSSGRFCFRGERLVWNLSQCMDSRFHPYNNQLDEGLDELFTAISYSPDGKWLALASIGPVSLLRFDSSVHVYGGFRFCLPRIYGPRIMVCSVPGNEKESPAGINLDTDILVYLESGSLLATLSNSPENPVSWGDSRHAQRDHKMRWCTPEQERVSRIEFVPKKTPANSIPTRAFEAGFGDNLHPGEVAVSFTKNSKWIYVGSSKAIRVPETDLADNISVHASGFKHTLAFTTLSARILSLTIDARKFFEDGGNKIGKEGKFEEELKGMSPRREFLELWNLDIH